MSDELEPSALLESRAREIAVKLRGNDQNAARAATRRALTRDGRVNLGNADATQGVLQPPSGGTGTTQGAQPPLPTPASDGQVLHGDTDRTLYWADDTGAGQRYLDATGAVDLADRRSLRFGAGIVAADGPTGALYLPPVIADGGTLLILVPVVDGDGDPVVTEDGSPVVVYAPLDVPFTVGDGLTLVGAEIALTIPVVVAHGGTGATTAAGARANLDAARAPYVALVGDGATEPLTVVHGRDTAAIGVTVTEVATGAVQYVPWRIIDDDTIAVSFGTPATTDQYRIVVH